MQVITQGANPQFRVTSVNGQPVSASGQIQNTSATSNNTVQSSAANAAQAIEQAPEDHGGGLATTVMTSPNSPPDALPPGSGLTVRLMQVTPPPQAEPQPGDEPAAAQPIPAQAAPAQAARAYAQSMPNEEPLLAALRSVEQLMSPSPEEGAQSVPQPALAEPPQHQAPHQAPNQPQTPAPPQIPEQAAPSPQSQTPPSQLQSGDTLSGTVPPNSRPSNPLVQTPAGLLSFQDPVDLPPGGKVDLKVMSPPTPPPPTAAPEQTPAFPRLQMGLDLLRLVSPELAEGITRHLPHLTAAPKSAPRLAMQMLALTTAARQGSAAALLSDLSRDSLDELHRGLLEDLDDALGSLRSTVTLPGSGPDPWQCYVMPYQQDGQMQQWRLIVRDRQGKQKQQARADDSTRFLMDLEMGWSRAGPNASI